MTNEDEEKFWDEIEEKVEIIRLRAAAYQVFIDPPGQPPLLWQMAMLAQAGWTELPRVSDPDPDKCFPEMHVEMREIELSSDYYCLIGGYEFSVANVPEEYNGHLLRPRPTKFEQLYFNQDPSTLHAPCTFQTEHFIVYRYAISRREPLGHAVRFETRHMFCVGSRAEQLVRERKIHRI